ncbi:MAG: hypothetical protein H7A23_07715 [Leptospiraceae bacterium]|nr:hypothetical protein [Leptospiraceae bacterium]
MSKEPKMIEFDLTYYSAITVKPKQPFWDWDAQISPDEQMDEQEKEEFIDVFLLPDFEAKEEMEDFLKKNFDSYFTQLLNSMYTEPKIWPEKRTYQMFLEWFEITFSPMVWIDEEELIKENDSEKGL